MTGLLPHLPVPLPSSSSASASAKSKRSFKNFFASKRSRRPTVAAVSDDNDNDLDLDFGCRGLKDEDEEVVVEDDVLLEIRAALPLMATKDRNCSHMASPHSARSSVSASFSSIFESSFFSAASPSVSSNSACASALLTPSLSSSNSCVSDSLLQTSSLSQSHESDSRVEHQKQQEQQRLAWHPDESPEHAELRRKQEEQAAVEALDAYFAIQAAEKQKQREHAHATVTFGADAASTAGGSSSGGGAIVEGRRASEPLNDTNSRRSRSKTVTDQMQAQQQGRRGSEPTLTLRLKRSQGSLRPAAAPAVSPRVSNPGASPAAIAGASVSASHQVPEYPCALKYQLRSPHSEAVEQTLIDSVAGNAATDKQWAQNPSVAIGSIGAPYTTNVVACLRPYARTAPGTVAVAQTRTYERAPLPSEPRSGRQRSSTTCGSRPMALYSPTLPSLASSVAQDAHGTAAAASSQMSTSAASRVNAAAAAPTQNADLAAKFLAVGHTKLAQGRQRSSSYFSTYYGKDYTGRVLSSGMEAGIGVALGTKPSLASTNLDRYASGLGPSSIDSVAPSNPSAGRI